MVALVFFSYASPDRAAALSIVGEIRRQGIAVWMDESGSDGGATCSGDIVQAIEQAEVVCLLVSPHSVSADHVRKEIELAAESQTQIIPLLLQAATIPPEIRYHLAGTQRVKVSADPEAGWSREVLAALERVGVKGDAAPAGQPGEGAETGPAPEASALHEEAYRHAVRVALADGTVTDSEAEQLTDLQKQYGLSHEAAQRIRAEEAARSRQAACEPLAEQETVQRPPTPRAMYESQEEIDRFFGALFQYRPVRILGAGAFGLAVLAFDETERVQKVFKLPKTQDTVRALKKEGENLVKLRGLLHPNIIQLYQYGRVRVPSSAGQEDRYYLCLAYGGKSLRDLLGEPRQSLDAEGNPCLQGSGKHLPVKQSIAIAMDVCQGLEAAHGYKGAAVRILHRDIKPENILLDEDTGQARITDFGVSRVIDRSVGTKSVAGTLIYMDPECFKGNAGTYSDIYSFGIVLYEMLTGVLPFRNFPERMRAGPEDPRSHNPELPPALAEIVLKALALDLDERYETASEMLADLRSAMAAIDPLPEQYESLATLSRTRRRCRDRESGGEVVVSLYPVEVSLDEIRNEAQALAIEPVAAGDLPAVQALVPRSCFATGPLVGVVYPAPAGEPVTAAWFAGPPHACEDFQRLCETVRGLCRLVAGAHDGNIVHGHLSPVQVTVLDGGGLALSGFGLGVLFRRSPSGAGGRRLMLEGFADDVGWMSPQLLQGGAIPTVADDVFSLGAMLFSWLTGSPWLDAAGVEELSQGGAGEATVHPRERNPLVPVRLDRVVARAMAFQPGERYPAVTALEEALAACRWPEDMVDGTIDQALRLYEEGDLVAACELLSEALDADPGNARIHYARGTIYLQEKEYRWAAEELRAAANVEPDPEALFDLAACLLEWDEGTREEAVAVLDRAASLYPEDERVGKLRSRLERV